MINIKVLSSLAKVFSDTEPISTEYKEFSMLKNEKLSFQIAFSSDSDIGVSVSIDSEISSCINKYLVSEVPVTLASFPDTDDFFIKKDAGLYPDILNPVDCDFNIIANKWYSLWIEIAPESKYTGEKIISVKLNDFCSEIKVNIIDDKLPEQEIIYTNWYHSDCLCDYYGIEAMSDEYWRINKNFIKCAVDHGMSCILTPLFTPALDTAVGHERTTVQLVGVKIRGGTYSFDFTNLKKWVDMCLDCGIKYFEMSHFFTQWGAKHAPKIVAKDRKGRIKKIFGWSTRTSSKKYDDFLRQFGKKLIEFIDKNNLRDKVFFHISDEPSERHLTVYKKRAKLMHEIFGGFPIIDALSDYEFYKMGTVDIPVPCENEFEKFYGKTDKVWTYYCCGQCREQVPNRFIAMPSQRNRALGVLMYKYNIEGFLQWGYNFYNSQYSLNHIDPFKVTDAGGKFPAGDSFVVYPDKDGSPLCSLRLKVLFEAFQDVSALKLLEKKIGRNEVDKIIGDISFKSYPKDENWLISLRNTVNMQIQAKD